MKKTKVLKKEQLFVEETALQRMLAAIFWFPEVEFSLTELARQADVSKSTIHRLLQQLIDQQIVTVEDKKIVFRIKANLQSFSYVKRKIAHNLRWLYESNLVEFLDETFRHPQAIILFGSFRKGDDISTSDIDIAVETVEDVEMHTVRPEGLENYEAFLAGRKIQIHLFNRKRIDINVFNNIANGIVLFGFLEANP